MSIGKPAALLFDLGGVLIDIDFDRAFRAWQPISRLCYEEIKRLFRFDDHYERHERGEISAAAYFEHLASSLQLLGTYDQIAEGWNAIFVDEIAETTRMVRRARAQLPCFALTNTNATHQAAWSSRFPAVTTSFDRIFASHELGFRKPEARAFEAIARAVGTPLDAMVFFDDCLQNVKSAQAAGLQAVHVRSPDDVRVVLQGIGITL